LLANYIENKGMTLHSLNILTAETEYYEEGNGGTTD